MLDNCEGGQSPGETLESLHVQSTLFQIKPQLIFTGAGSRRAPKSVTDYSELQLLLENQSWITWHHKVTFFLSSVTGESEGPVGRAALARHAAHYLAE